MPWMEQLESANWNQASALALGAYVLGCLTTGYYLVRRRTGEDIRTLGSGSVGARNVGRVLGWPGFGLTLLGDFAKGAIAVWAAHHFTKDERLVALTMLAVTVGHVWPAQLWFRGGKGVATSLGALAMYDFRLALGFLLLFAAAFALARRTVVAGLFAFACLPLVGFYEQHDPAKAVALSLLGGLIWLAHRKNLADEFAALVERRHLRPKHQPPEL